MWFRRNVGGEAAETPAETVEPQAPPRKKRMGYFERRRQRRKRRKLFEEAVAWIIVPALIYAGYLIYKALGGLPPGSFDFVSEVVSLVLRGGKQ